MFIETPNKITTMSENLPCLPTHFCLFSMKLVTGTYLPNVRRCLQRYLLVCLEINLRGPVIVT